MNRKSRVYSVLIICILLIVILGTSFFIFTSNGNSIKITFFKEVLTASNLNSLKNEHSLTSDICYIIGNYITMIIPMIFFGCFFIYKIKNKKKKKHVKVQSKVNDCSKNINK